MYNIEFYFLQSTHNRTESNSQISFHQLCFDFQKVITGIHKLLTYQETNWKNKKGFKIHTYGIRINRIDASKTRKEQQRKVEKISLVAFLDKEQKKPYVNFCRRLRRVNKDFYQNKNLHITIFGFGPLKKQEYQMIQKRLEKFFTRKSHFNLIVNLDTIRFGTMYLDNKTLTPFQGTSNGTVIALGDVAKNKTLFSFSNLLTRFLLKDTQVRSILGSNFRKKFPVVWSTLGYFNADELKINHNLLNFFVKKACLIDDSPSFTITEIHLVKSKYKNLRYPKLIQKYSVNI